MNPKNSPEQRSKPTRLPPINWPLILIAVFVFASLFVLSRDAKSATPTNRQEVALPSIITAIKANNVSNITVRGDYLTVSLFDGVQLEARKESSISVVETLLLLGVGSEQLENIPIMVTEPDIGFERIFRFLMVILPFTLILYLIFRFSRTDKTSDSFSLPTKFGRSNPRVVSNSNDTATSGERPSVGFDDVAGSDQAKLELMEVVDFLKDGEKFLKLGARIPKGVLMAGPPGTGKTLIAKAVAGEAGVPFFSISGSEFVEMFVGVGASRVRDLFKRARDQAPAVIFVDEIDAVGRQRGVGLGGGNDEREQTLNQILVEMDGFDTDTSIIIMAATNRPDVLDPALLRPGRFDRKVTMERPDVVGREAILNVHSKGKPLADDVQMADLAKLTPGFVGADLENLMNEAAILAARRDMHEIGPREFQDAMERIIAGPERKSTIISDQERAVIAYHEAGHAVVMHHLEHCDPVHKVSIVSRGMALGYTMPLPEGDKYLRSKEAFEDEIASLLGGRAAEEIFFQRITTGAANDLERATILAHDMITRYGFSERLGLRTYGEGQGNPYLGAVGQRRNYSEEMAQTIDDEMRSILDQAYQRAKSIISKKRKKMESLALALLDIETVERLQFEAMMV